MLISRQSASDQKPEEKPAATTTTQEPTKPSTPPEPAPEKVVEPTAPATQTPVEEPKPASVKVNRPKVAVVPVPEVPSQAPTQTPQQPPAVVQEPPKPSADDQAFLDSLTEDERDEYELALYAAKANPVHAGKPGEVLAFFKKVQQFTASHPDSQPDSQEFQQLIDQNRPRWAPGEKRKLSKKMIEDAAVERAKAEIHATVSKDLDATNAKLREIEKGPDVSRRVAEFKQNALSQVPEGYSRIDPDVIAKASTLSRGELIEQYPVEGVVLAKHFDAVTALERIKEGVEEFSPSNQTHAFLLAFLNQQEQYLAAAPNTIKKDHAGRTWVSRMQMEQLLTKDPAAQQKYWFIDNEMLKSQLAVHAHEEVGNRVDQLVKAGFERKQPAKTATPAATVQAAAPATPAVKPVVPAVASTNPHAGPKASVSTAPGAETVTRAPSEAEKFIQSRVPGYKLG